MLDAPPTDPARRVRAHALARDALSLRSPDAQHGRAQPQHLLHAGPCHREERVRRPRGVLVHAQHRVLEVRHARRLRLEPLGSREDLRLRSPLVRGRRGELRRRGRGDGLGDRVSRRRRTPRRAERRRRERRWHRLLGGARLLGELRVRRLRQRAEHGRAAHRVGHRQRPRVRGELLRRRGRPDLHERGGRRRLPPDVDRGRHRRGQPRLPRRRGAERQVPAVLLRRARQGRDDHALPRRRVAHARLRRDGLRRHANGRELRRVQRGRDEAVRRRRLRRDAELSKRRLERVQRRRARARDVQWRRR